MIATRTPVRVPRRAPPGAWAVALAVVLVAATAHADPCPAVCPPGWGCSSDASARQCDTDQFALATARDLLSSRTLRLDTALRDARTLTAALTSQSALVLDLRAELASERARWPAWGWWLFGAGVGVLATVALALSL